MLLAGKSPGNVVVLAFWLPWKMQNASASALSKYLLLESVLPLLAEWLRPCFSSDHHARRVSNGD